MKCKISGVVQSIAGICLAYTSIFVLQFSAYVVHGSLLCN